MSYASDTSSPPIEFDWQRQPSAAAFVNQLAQRAVASTPIIATLAERMKSETGTRLVDWIDAVALPDRPALRAELKTLGYAPGDPSNADTWQQAEGLFPTLLLRGEPSQDESPPPIEVTVKVSSVDDFARAHEHACDLAIMGKSGDRCRTAEVKGRNGADSLPRLNLIERHGWTGHDAKAATARQVAMAAKHRTSIAARPRDGDDLEAGFSQAVRLVQAAAEDLAPAWAADLFFAAERDYWMSRNHAAQVQFARQQQLGLGWANHDHHTYRSSRECFHLLVNALEQMGFSCRERFYAGREAGWGAQVLEHHECGVVIFADVDLSPDEVSGDFAHHPLPHREHLGTVGLWCQLHGESFLAAGMHHLECQFDFDAAREQLATAGVETMAPFTDFPHLKQAFTCGEMWPVSEPRIQAVLDAGLITAEQAETFRRDGALGSHMEILERNDGYKGFNQTGISEIIARTDPRGVDH
ncbi:hypothetical protein OAS39_02700 [Pirellulales bacterium]|nr:hypothetical protein [Pirellulales bacterium]